jgi:hypothetical protein
VPLHALLHVRRTLLAVVLTSAVALSGPVAADVAAAVPSRASADAKPQKTIMDASFDGTKVGKVDARSFRGQVGSAPRRSRAYLGMTYRKDPRGSGNVVRTKLAKGKTIHSTGAGRGNLLMVKLPGSYDTACMSYDIRFAAGFDFAAGGKLPGLVGVAPGVAPGTPEGGGSTAHGWSGRLMWLGSSMWQRVRAADRSNLLVTYLYHPGRAGTWGDNVSWGSSFEPGAWHRVKQCIVMNQIGKADGVLLAWFDDRLVLDQHDVVYRTDPRVHITHVDWSIFRGGADSAWASRKNGYVDLDNVKVTAR